MVCRTKHGSDGRWYRHSKHAFDLRRVIQSGPLAFVQRFSSILQRQLSMKGIVLAGGLGTRLYPLTKITNKHLLPVYNRPMIYYPIQTLVDAGISEILIVTGGNSAGDFLKLLGNGKEFWLKHMNYTYQEGEDGIAAALWRAE